MCGDYNLPKINWHYTDSLQYTAQADAISPVKMASSIICETYSSLDLSQLFPNHNLKNYSLDLLFGDKNIIKYLHSDDQLVALDYRHHISVSFSINLTAQENEYNHTTKYNFRKLNSDAFSTCLNCIDWDDMLNFEILRIKKNYTR